MRFVKTAESIFLIPSGFTRVEYLESTGTQYIDTGTTLSNNTSIDMKIGTTIPWERMNVFGARESANSKNIGIVVGNPGATSTEVIDVDFNSSNYATYRAYANYTQNTDYIIHIDKNYRKINNVSNTTVCGDIFTTTTNAYIFSMSGTPPSGNASFTGKVYFCKIWDNDVLIRDFIPCIDPLGVPCMYDLVGNKPYYNSGTGTFNVGRKIIPVEYLESTGTQYIDTGIGFNENTVTKCKFAFVEQTITNAKHLIGAQTDTTSARYNPLYCTLADGQRIIRTLTNIAGTTNITRQFDTNIHTIEFNTYPSKQVIYDGVVEGTVSSVGSSNITLNLFRRNLTNNWAYVSGRIYGCQFLNQNTLLRDFIPCKDENNVGFMFDKVSGTTYLNAGTGAFSFGEPVYTSKLRLIRDTDGKVRFIQDVLPREYRPLKYIQSTGTQYIDTGYKPNNNTKVEARFKMNETPNYTKWLFHARNQTVAGDGYGFGCTGSGYITSDFNNRVSSSTVKLTSGTIYNIVKDKNICKVNDITLTNTNSTFTIDYSLLIFALNDHDSVTAAIPEANCYYFRIYDNEVPVRDFYPALRKSDNKPGMYDRITKQFFTNNATSGNDFNYG